jgi:hypothetical protein
MRKLLTPAVGLLLIFALSPAPAAGQGAASADRVVARVMGLSITQGQLDDPDAKIAGIDFGPGEKNLSEEKKAEQRRLRLESVIWKQLREEYYRRNGVVATRAEMNAFARAIFKQRAARGVNRMLAEAAVKGWKFDRALYRQYGGTVIFQQSNPFEPVGAYRKFLEEHEGKRSFEILDPALRESFWAYYTGEPEFVVPPAEVNYETPWWLQKPKQ